MSNSMSDNEEQEEQNQLHIQTQKRQANIPSMIDPHVMQIVGQSSLLVMFVGIPTQETKMPSVNTAYDTREDFDWFTSGQVETDSFKGQHIAIWKKQIAGSGETPIEAERMAKANCGSDCRPAVVYIPEDEEVDTIF